jgi:hypothetical protein
MLIIEQDNPPAHLPSRAFLAEEFRYRPGSVTCWPCLNKTVSRGDREDLFNSLSDERDHIPVKTMKNCGENSHAHLGV